MRFHRSLIGVAVAAILFLAAACAGAQDPQQSGSEKVDSYDSLLAALRTRGAAVDSKGTVTQPFFESEGQIISIGGEDVQVFEFASDKHAHAAAQTISKEGSAIGTTISWIASPHFFMNGKLIVLYVGDAESVLDLLTELLGPQIAGS